jgi:acylphosphatase
MNVSNDILNKIKISAKAKLQVRHDIRTNRVNLYMSNRSVPAGDDVVLGLNRRITLPRESVIVLVDHAPLYNWGHSCEHMLYDAKTGDYYDTHPSQFPPADYYHSPDHYDAIHAPVAIPTLTSGVAVAAQPTSIPELNYAIANATGKKYAILFSGMSNNRHLNDLEFLYRTLVDVYTFDPANITVLNYDGTVNYAGTPQPVTTWPGNNTPYRIKVNGSGTNTALGQALDAIKTKLQSNDLLLVHTNNHGGGPTSDPEAWLCCYPNWNSFTATDFANKVKVLPVFGSLVVMMEQCYSGGFQDAVLNNSKATCTSFAAACIATANSMSGADFDPFAKDWIAGVAGRNPNGSALSTTVSEPASAYDVFAYANAVKVEGDSPQFADKPANCGKSQYLTGIPQKTFSTVIASGNSDGRLEVLAIGTDNALWHIWQTAPNNGWSALASMGGIVKEIAAAKNQDGRLEVLAIGSDNALWHIWQKASNNGWSAWTSMGGIVKEIATAKNQDGRLEVFAIGSDNALWHIWQTAPNNGWSAWASMGGGVKHIRAGNNADGRIEVFAIGTDNALWHIWQKASNNGWSAWTSMGGIVKEIATAKNQDGRLEVFAIGSDNALWHIWQTAPNNGWSTWGKLT